MGIRTLLYSGILTALLAAGCSSSPGTDSISSRGSHGGAQISDCVSVCHSNASSASPDPLATNGTGTSGKHIRHVQEIGLACDDCHTGYLNNTNHMNGNLDTQNENILLVYFDSTKNPDGSWTSDTGAYTGSCASVSCHGPDTVAWYGTDTWSPPACSVCHQAAVGTRRQVMGAAGDFSGNASIVSRHVTSTADPAPAQCLVCHDQSTHTTGTVRLRNADTGASIVYSAATPSSLEPFCLSCHDASGAESTFITGGTPTNPFNDGSVLGGPPPNPYQAGDKIAGYWNSANVHKSNGNLTCAGTGLASTGCHGNSGKINMHGSANAGLLTGSMNFQISLAFNGPNTFVYDNYMLCFDCHENYQSVSAKTVLGYKQGGKYDVAWAPTPTEYYTDGIKSLFRDRYIPDDAHYPSYWEGEDPLSPFYNDSPLLNSYAPLHNYHLLGDWAAPASLSWKYRGDAAKVGRITCTACHNVHGTNGTVRSTYAELGIIANSPYTPRGPDEYKTLADGAFFDQNVMISYPMNCNINCHFNLGNTSYWHSPADE